MAYRTPKVVLTQRKHGKRPALCAKCGRPKVVFYIVADVARCEACGRVWHPADVFFRAARSRRAKRRVQNHPKPNIAS